MAQILVTGGCGYIGSHLVKSLSQSGEKVVVLDNLVAGRKEALLQGETLVVGDITDHSSLTKLFSEYPIDLVIHCAALVNAAESVERAKEYLQVNDQGSHNVWEAAITAGVKHFIYASSAAVYGIPQDQSPLKESSPLSPSNPYGTGKLAGENSLKELVGDRENYAIFRFFNVAGADSTGQLRQNPSSRAIMERLFAVAKGDEPKLTLSGHDYDTPDGTVIRDFIHVEDIVSAVLSTVDYLRSDKPSFTANLGTGIPTSILQLHSLAESVTGKTISIEYRGRNPGDISYSLADIGLIQTILGWKPSRTVTDMLKDGWNAYVKI